MPRHKCPFCGAMAKSTYCSNCGRSKTGYPNPKIFPDKSKSWRKREAARGRAAIRRR